MELMFFIHPTKLTHVLEDPRVGLVFAEATADGTYVFKAHPPDGTFVV